MTTATDDRLQMLEAQVQTLQELHEKDQRQVRHYRDKASLLGWELHETKRKLERTARRAGAHRKNIRQMQRKLEYLYAFKNSTADKVGNH